MSALAIGSITDVPGVLVGHYTNLAAATGCTVALYESGAVVGVDVRGAAPGTRETDLLRPGTLVERVHATLLTGGSAFGLAAAGGVMRFLEQRGIGHKTAAGVVPIVPAAVIYDLGIGRADVRPGEEAGFSACEVASKEPVAVGSVGAGTGATVGKVLGQSRMCKGGLGSASLELASGVRVGALVVVNAGGNVADSAKGHVVAGVRADQRGWFEDAERLILDGLAARQVSGTNTTLALIATDAPIDKALANRLASLGHDALARSLRPVHTMFDGDTVFAASTAVSGRPTIDFNALAIAACMTVERAVVNAVVSATGLAGVPSASEWMTELG